MSLPDEDYVIPSIEIENNLFKRKIMLIHLSLIRQIRMKNYLLISFHKRVSNDSLTLSHKIDKTARSHFSDKIKR